MESTKIVYVISELNNYTNITFIKYKNKCLLNNKKIKNVYNKDYFELLFRRNNEN